MRSLWSIPPGFNAKWHHSARRAAVNADLSFPPDVGGTTAVKRGTLPEKNSPMRQMNFVRPGIAIGSGSNFVSQSLISGTSTCWEFWIISQVSCWPV